MKSIEAHWVGRGWSGNGDYSTGAIEALIGLPGRWEAEVGGALKLVSQPGLPSKLDRELAIGDGYAAQGGTDQSQNMDGDRGAYSGGVIQVEHRSGNRITTWVGPAMGGAETSIGNNCAVTKIPFELAGSSGDKSRNWRQPTGGDFRPGTQLH